MKRLIVNADDFGISSGANRAIIKAWREGVLTSASLMVMGVAADEAAAVAKENPGLQVGLHLTLVQGKALLANGNFPSLTDAHGDFTNDPVMAGMRYYFLRSLRRQLKDEIEGQIQKFLHYGLPLSHVDGHLNIHMHPTVFRILLKLMPQYGIETFRLSRERLLPELSIDRHRIFGKMADSFIFGRLASFCRPELEMRRIRYAGEVKGLLNSGRMTEQYLVRSLDSLQNGLTEIYFHPGYRDQLLQKWMPDYRHEDELSALTSRKVMERLKELGVVLVNYRGDEKTVKATFSQ